MQKIEMWLHIISDNIDYGSSETGGSAFSDFPKLAFISVNSGV